VKCSLGCGADVMYVKTAASGGRRTIAVNAEPAPNGTAWFEKGKDHKGKECNLLVVTSKDHPRPPTGRFFRLHNFDCGPHHAREEIKAALARAAKKRDTDAEEITDAETSNPVEEVDETDQTDGAQTLDLGDETA
jgi:hypothetical protein